MQIFQRLDLTVPRNLVIGQHSIWLKDLRIKVPFQHGGRVQKYRKPIEQSYLRETIAEEYAFLQWLASQGKAPPVGDWIFFEEVISPEHLNGWWSDPQGAYGFRMDDATTLPPGDFTVEWLRETGMVVGSEGAWSDLNKPGNVVNGYLIDVRRSWWDRLQYLGPVPEMPFTHEDLDDLKIELRRDGAFPFRERELPYQEHWVGGRWVGAEREVVNRAQIMEFAPKPGESVVDLGCCTGGFLQYAALRRAQPLIGIDIQREFLYLAKRLARAAGMNICYRRGDLAAVESAGALASWIKGLVPGGVVDHLIALSMAKHIGEDRLAWWLDNLPARNVYIETNAVKPGQTPLRSLVLRPTLYDSEILVGETRDRNPRHVYKLRRTIEGAPMVVHGPA